MLIRSDFHDYYDSVTAYGIDKTVIYRRKRAEIMILRWDGKFTPKPDLEIFNKVRYEGVEHTFVFNKSVIGFCGNLIPTIRLSISVNHYVKPTRINHYFYNALSCLSFLQAHSFFTNKRVMRHRWSLWRGMNIDVDMEGGLATFFDIKTWEPLKMWFIKYQVPIFRFGENEQPKGLVLELNPMLKAYRFPKDAASAFQDVYLYISGVLGVQAPKTVEIDDKHKAIAHGHDGQYSFRKPPGGGQWR